MLLSNGAAQQLMLDYCDALPGVQAPQLSRAMQVGKPLAALPLEPRFGRALLAAADLGCLQEAVAVIALASGPSVFHTPR